MPSYPCCAQSCLGRDILSENEGENGKVISAYIQVASSTFFLQQSILKTQLSSPKGLVDEVRRGDSLVFTSKLHQIGRASQNILAKRHLETRLVFGDSLSNCFDAIACRHAECFLLFFFGRVRV